MRTLRDIAHARAGDKGDTAQLSVIAYRPEDYAFLERWLTAERVATYFAGTVHGGVMRHELPALGAMIFVMENALGSGVTRSLALDAHGKTLGATLLGMPLPDDAPG